MLEREILGIDIGGSFIKSAPVNIDSGKLVGEDHKVETPQPATPDRLSKSLRGLLEHHGWRGPVGVGFPGVVRSGVVYTAVNLHDDWVGLNIESTMRELTDAHVRAVNDADAAGLAEMTFGVGPGEGALAGGTVLTLTLGTGIGSALFVNRQLVLNTEFGHIYSEDGIEAEKLAAASVREKQDMSWEAWGARVDWYLNAMERLVTPDLIIVGGGVTEAWEKFAPYLKVQTRVVPAKLGNKAGLVGAAYALEYFAPKETDDR